MITQTHSGSGPVVLFVDDEPKLCRIISKILAEDGYDVFTADSGGAALELAARVHPDVVVLDINMPIMNGVEVLREMRTRGLECPVIMLTAQGTLQTAREAMSLGAFDYMTKPFDLHLFKKALLDARTAGGRGEN